MKNATSIWMAILTFTAVLFAVVLLSSRTPTAQAAMLNAQAEYSLMTSGKLGGDEALIIIDKASQKMIVYRIQNNTIEPIAGTNFGR